MASRTVAHRVTVCTEKQLSPDRERLIDAARSARDHAYCPYSNFRVGAAVLCEDNTVVSGECTILHPSLVTLLHYP